MLTRIVGLLAVLAMVCMSGASAQTSTGEAGPSLLRITCDLKASAGGANPLAGRHFVLMKQSFNDYLKQNHKFEGPPGTTVKFSPLTAWAYASRTGNPIAQQTILEARAILVAAAKLDDEGRGIFTAVPAGTYYVFGQGAYEGMQVLWDTKVVLHAGTNEFTLNKANLAHINGEEEATTQPTGDADTAATKRTAPVEKKPVPVAAGPKRPSGPKVSTLNVRALSDSDQPLRRTTFYVLDDNFESILKRAGYKQQMLLGKELPYLNSFEVQARWMAMKETNPLFKILESTTGEATIPPEIADQFKLACTVLKEHTVAVITTNGTGVATTPRLPAGTYYVYGTANQYVKDGYTGTVSNGTVVSVNEQGHQAATIWNVKVVLKSGSNTVKLTPDNAAFAGN